MGLTRGSCLIGSAHRLGAGSHELPHGQYGERHCGNQDDAHKICLALREVLGEDRREGCPSAGQLDQCHCDCLWARDERVLIAPAASVRRESAIARNQAGADEG